MIAPSFADIFYSNCFKNGTLPIALSEEKIEDLFQRHARKASYQLTIDLEKQTVSDDSGFQASFDVEPYRRHCLLHGLDDIALTLEHVDEIDRYERTAGIAE